MAANGAVNNVVSISEAHLIGSFARSANEVGASGLQRLDRTYRDTAFLTCRRNLVFRQIEVDRSSHDGCPKLARVMLRIQPSAARAPWQD